MKWTPRDSPAPSGLFARMRSIASAASPLTVLYEVFPQDAVVEVFSVFYWRRRKE